MPRTSCNSAWSKAEQQPGLRFLQYFYDILLLDYKGARVVDKFLTVQYVTVQYVAFFPMILVTIFLLSVGAVRLVAPNWLKRHRSY
jgi:hypothetical protein